MIIIPEPQITFEVGDSLVNGQQPEELYENVLPDEEVKERLKQQNEDGGD